MKLKFICVGSPAMCEAHSEMQSMSLLGGSGGMSLKKFLKKAYYEIKSGAF